MGLYLRSCPFFFLCALQVSDRVLDLDTVRILVFDEADEMLKADAFADESGAFVAPAHARMCDRVQLCVGLLRYVGTAPLCPCLAVLQSRPLNPLSGQRQQPQILCPSSRRLPQCA